MIDLSSVFHILTHSVGEASEGSSGWLPSLLGSGLGTYGNIMKSAVESKIKENQQQDQDSAQKRVEDRASWLP